MPWSERGVESNANSYDRVLHYNKVSQETDCEDIDTTVRIRELSGRGLLRYDYFTHRWGILSFTPPPGSRV